MENLQNYLWEFRTVAEILNHQETPPKDALDCETVQFETVADDLAYADFLFQPC